MGHGTSDILDNLKESLFNVTEKLKEFGNETDFEKVLKVNNEVSDVLASLKELDEALTSFTSEQVAAKLEEATNLINTVQTKLDNDDFKGDRGVSISKVENKNNKLVITDSEAKEYDLGNYTNDYNLLLNKPFSDTIVLLDKFDFNDGVSTSLFYDLYPFGDYIASLSFQTAGFGGSTYLCSLLFFLSSTFNTNSNDSVPLPFSLFSHYSSGRKFELFLESRLGHLPPLLSLKINGESSTLVPVTLKLKRILF